MDIQYNATAYEGLLLESKCYMEHLGELHNSTYENAGNVLLRPFSHERRKVKRLSSYWYGVWEREENKVYDDELKLMGIMELVIGIIIVVFMVSFFDDMLNSENGNMSSIVWMILSMAVIVLGILAMVIGGLKIYRPTQEKYLRKCWADSRNLRYSRFRHKLCEVIKEYPKVEEIVIISVTQIFLYQGAADFLPHPASGMPRQKITVNYEYMECIYETKNLFVVMVKDEDIFSFPKCDMSLEEQEKLRSLLSPYYKRGYKPEALPNQLFRDM